MENSLERVLTEIRVIRKVMRQRLKKEVDLSLENQKLKVHLLELENLLNNEKIATADKKIKIKSSLKSLYNDGFHICNTFYGNRFLTDEECLLCLGMLDR